MRLKPFVLGPEMDLFDDILMMDKYGELVE
jgi:hypothetical protein